MMGSTKVSASAASAKVDDDAEGEPDEDVLMQLQALYCDADEDILKKAACKCDGDMDKAMDIVTKLLEEADPSLPRETSSHRQLDVAGAGEVSLGYLKKFVDEFCTERNRLLKLREPLVSLPEEELKSRLEENDDDLDKTKKEIEDYYEEIIPSLIIKSKPDAPEPKPAAEDTSFMANLDESQRDMVVQVQGLNNDLSLTQCHQCCTRANWNFEHAAALAVEMRP